MLACLVLHGGKHVGESILDCSLFLNDAAPHESAQAWMFQHVVLARHSALVRESAVRIQHDARPAEIAQELMLQHDVRWKN